MVRVIIAFACVSLLCPSSALFAQARSSGAKSPPAQSGGRKQPGVRAQPVAQAQDVPADASQKEAAIQLGNDQVRKETKPLDPELEELLKRWSEASEKINRLEGEHTRLVYDLEFEVERQAKGLFFYEKIDKGRINIEPVEITEKLKQDRAKEVAEAREQKRKSGVRQKKNGEPYDLQPDQKEQWSCDGERVYSLDLEKMEAMVAQLPANMQGKNIMDSPLPFLFGMPPERAKERFDLEFSSPFEPKSGLAYLKILPRMAKDAQSWSQANVILDLKKFLPVAVQLLDPAETKVTVYKFRDIKVNGSEFLDIVFMKNPKTRYTPDLRQFSVMIAGSEAPKAPGEAADEQLPKTALVDPSMKKPAENGLVNVSGLPHKEAVLQLERQGLKRTKDEPTNEIVLQPGPPAKNKEDIYTVKSQDPAPGTPLKPGMKVKLVLWNDPAAAKKQ